MNNTDNILNEYSTMVQEIGVDKFTERFEELKKTANEFIDEAGYGGHVECNERILLNVLLDYWADIFRLKDLQYFYFSTNACFQGKRSSLQPKAKNNFALILRWFFITSNIGNVTLRLLN